ncbi:putative transcription factor GRF family [Helianthus anomalus]
MAVAVILTAVVLTGTLVLVSQVVCACGSATIIRTSWTATNPGRRFHCCAREGSNCGFVS